MTDKKIHIAIFTDTYRPLVNGIITSIDHLTIRLAEKGHRISIISPTINSEVKPLHENITLIHVPSIPASYYDDFRWSTLRISKLYDKLKDTQVDVVHFMTPIFTCYLGIKIARKLNVPIVGTYHTLLADPTYYEQLLKRIIRATPDSVWYYTNLYYNAADLVTAPTQNMINLMEKNYCTTKMIAISNGIDPSIFDNTRKNEIRTKYGLGDQTVLYVGRVSIEKNINVLIDAFELVNEKIPQSQLLIVGDGPKRNEIEDYASKKKCSSKIIFTGMVPHDELVKSGIFGACRVFATASETETQGITLLEALHNGLPCVGADALGVAETISHGETGILVPPHDREEMSKALISLLTDEELYQSMSREAQLQIKKHYIDEIINRWESVYLDLINDYTSGRIPKKDYLHIKQIVGTLKRFKIAIPFTRVS